MDEHERGTMASDEQDSRDMRNLAYNHLSLTRCVCGRLKRNGYICDFCHDFQGLHFGAPYLYVNEEWIPIHLCKKCKDAPAANSAVLCRRCTQEMEDTVEFHRAALAKALEIKGESPSDTP